MKEGGHVRMVVLSIEALIRNGYHTLFSGLNQEHDETLIRHGFANFRLHCFQDWISMV